jgi:hypothetical protein
MWSDAVLFEWNDMEADMRIANFAAWIVLGVIAAGQAAVAGEIHIVAQNRPEQSRTRSVKDLPAEQKRLTENVMNGTSQAGRDKAPVSAPKSPLNAEPGLIF